MNAVILSRWSTGLASRKERRSAIANDPIRRLSGVFGALPEGQSVINRRITRLPINWLRTKSV
jgi:hypothetical protein